MPRHYSRIKIPGRLVLELLVTEDDFLGEESDDDEEDDLDLLLPSPI